MKFFGKISFAFALIFLAHAHADAGGDSYYNGTEYKVSAQEIGDLMGGFEEMKQILLEAKKNSGAFAGKNLHRLYREAIERATARSSSRADLFLSRIVLIRALALDDLLKDALNANGIKSYWKDISAKLVLAPAIDIALVYYKNYDENRLQRGATTIQMPNWLLFTQDQVPWILSIVSYAPTAEGARQVLARGLGWSAKALNSSVDRRAWENQILKLVTAERGLESDPTTFSSAQNILLTVYRELTAKDAAASSDEKKPRLIGLAPTLDIGPGSHSIEKTEEGFWKKASGVFPLFGSKGSRGALESYENTSKADAYFSISGNLGRTAGKGDGREGGRTSLRMRSDFGAALSPWKMDEQDQPGRQTMVGVALQVLGQLEAELRLNGSQIDGGRASGKVLVQGLPLVVSFGGGFELDKNGSSEMRLIYGGLTPCVLVRLKDGTRVQGLFLFGFASEAQFSSPNNEQTESVHPLVIAGSLTAMKKAYRLSLDYLNVRGDSATFYERAKVSGRVPLGLFLSNDALSAELRVSRQADFYESAEKKSEQKNAEAGLFYELVW